MTSRDDAMADIALLIEENKDNPRPKQKVRLRVAKACEIAVKHFKGNIVEIGAMKGLTTRMFCEIARKNNRRVVVVDPWIAGTQNCEGHEYEAFLKNTEEYKDVLTVLRHRSDHLLVWKYMADLDIAFCFVDGLHMPEVMSQDVRMTAHAKMICCDDIGYDYLGLLPPFIELIKELDKTGLYHLPLREGYLL